MGDELNIARAIRRVLRSGGYTISTAGDAAQAMELTVPLPSA
ncbi:MAG: hypothetical protein AAF513_15805 [Pseudomonadota bacterium]